MIDLPQIQQALAAAQLDGWLLCDFRGNNSIARRILHIPDDRLASRRWYYWIPAQGEPLKLVHHIEPKALEHLPGRTQLYLQWQQLETLLATLVTGKRVALEYSPRNAIPYLSKVDAGTVELLRASGGTVVSSGDLVQQFEAVWDDEQWQLHLQAAHHTDAAYGIAWNFIAERTRQTGWVHELEVQQVILDYFASENLFTDHGPIVAVGPHSADPHYAPLPGEAGNIGQGSFVLIDLWAKCQAPRAVYSDLTRVGFVGSSVPSQYEQVFAIVAAARDAAIEKVRTAMAANQPLPGWAVDQTARDVIAEAGYGEAFVHRTGHSIGQELHGNGAHLDNLETHDERLLLPRTCFSVEPGIYLPGQFGIRSEVDVFIDSQRQVHVTGSPQTAVLPIWG